jgi:hypothetical protein
MPRIPEEAMKRPLTWIAVTLVLALTGLTGYVMTKQAEKLESLSREVDHLATLVDLTCRPAKE